MLENILLYTLCNTQATDVECTPVERGGQFIIIIPDRGPGQIVVLYYCITVFLYFSVSVSLYSYVCVFVLSCIFVFVYREASLSLLFRASVPVKL